MIKTTINHFILDHAISVIFDRIAKNFGKSPTDFISSVEIGDTIPYMEVNYNGYIIKSSMKVIDIVIMNFEGTKNRAYFHLLPIGTANIITTDEADEDYVMPIEYLMEWLEEAKDYPIHTCTGVFAESIAVSSDDIIKVGK